MAINLVERVHDRG